MDAADLLDQYTDAIYAATYTADEVAALKARKKLNETVMLCRTILRDESWEHDATVNELDVYLTYASALESLTRRYEAIDVLVRGLDVMDDHPMLQLALARLQFKAGLYNDALETCLLVMQAYPHDTRCSADSAADAYHLAGTAPSSTIYSSPCPFSLGVGWVKIHGDDHTNAYALWSRGALAIPSSSVLARQHRKRQCWDNDAPDDFLLPHGLVGQGTSGLPAEGFAVPASTRAVALFDPTTQANRLVFRSSSPLLTKGECDAVIDIVDAFHRDVRHGQWGTVRHSSVNTTDVAVEDIPLLRPWLRKLLNSRVYPFLHECFPRLADHTSMRDDTTGATRCRVHDAFIVRYDELDQSLSLPEHNDTSVVSVVVSLNDRFVGGGTWFHALQQVVDAPVGHAVAFAGPLRHGGHAITSGCRLILVLFLYVDGFAYGDYLNAVYDDVASPQDTDKGFVVYNQTVELVATLNQAPTSMAVSPLDVAQDDESCKQPKHETG